MFRGLAMADIDYGKDSDILNCSKKVDKLITAMNTYLLLSRSNESPPYDPWMPSNKI